MLKNFFKDTILLISLFLSGILLTLYIISDSKFLLKSWGAEADYATNTHPRSGYYSIKKEAYKNGEIINEIKYNDEFIYKLNVSGDALIYNTDILIFDKIPDEFIILETDGKVNGQTVTWEFSTNTEDYTDFNKTFYIKVKVVENVNKLINNCAIMDVEGYSHTSCNSVYLGEVVYDVVKSSSKNEVTDGEVFDYFITVNNKSDLMLQDLILTDLLDETLIIVDSKDAIVTNNLLSWELSLEPYESKTFSFSVKLGVNNISNNVVNNAKLVYGNKEVFSNYVTVNFKDIVNPKTGLKRVNYLIIFVSLCLCSLMFYYLNIKKSFKRI